MRIRVLLIAAAGIVLAVPHATAQVASDTLLQVRHYLDWETVSDPQISPDGSQILYTRRWVNAVEDR